VAKDRIVDYYKVLQVDPEADREVIAAAYRRLALKYHPDANRSAGAEEMMKLLSEAYAVLSDPQERARYDAVRREFVEERGGAAPVRAGQHTRGELIPKILIRVGLVALIVLAMRANPRLGGILALAIIVGWLLRGFLRK
jgi:curved DNA-binding protein CbpA